jgi:small subunit ribosomal protein S21
LHREEVRKTVTRVVAEEGESIDSLLRRFNKKVQNDRILSEIRRRRFYEPPTVIRKRKKAAKLRKSRRTTMKYLRRIGEL